MAVSTADVFQFELLNIGISLVGVLPALHSCLLVWCTMDLTYQMIALEDNSSKLLRSLLYILLLKIPSSHGASNRGF